ncbi:type II toxin-antitoxin system PemK/MazF family toxin [Streptomyces sp. NPDC052687]|uniref:type II toxin-antitoxin system PemK/MazF family toxin n=1 Tax=Streptomyces sp. NPDC052687 TaxID=3154759 RepID=UPI003446B579
MGGAVQGARVRACAGNVVRTDTSWWPAPAAVVLLALVAVLVCGWGRRRPSGNRSRGRDEGARPRPAEIWWADGPCLVLSVRGRRARVAKITSGYRDERAGVVPLPPGAVGDTEGRAGFLETDELCEVPVGDFRRRVGVVDPVLWDQVRHLTR